MIIPVPHELLLIADKLSENVYVVGGYVRNYLLFGSSLGTDIDICGALKVDQVVDQLKGLAKVVPVNPRIGTVLISIGDYSFEYTTFRRDNYPFGGAHTPSSVDFVESYQEDCLRRDFTINSIYYDVKNQCVIDVLGGVGDLKKGIIRTTRHYSETFGEDGLRLMRAVRFAAQLGFELSSDCSEGLTKSSYLLADITGERKRQEFDLIITADCKYCVKNAHVRGLELLKKYGLFDHLLTVGDLFKNVDDLFTDRAIRILSEAKPDERLPAIVVLLTEGLSLSVGQKVISESLNIGGLRYSRETIDECLYIHRCLTSISTIDDLKIEMIKRLDLVGKLTDLGLLFDRICADALPVCERLKNNGVPLSLKELKVSGVDCIDLDIPASVRGIALKRILIDCLTFEVGLSRDEQLLILKRYAK